MHISQQEKVYNQIRKLIKNYLNLFLKRSEKSALGFGLRLFRLEYSKREHDGFITGLFFENGRIGILQASNYNFVDQVSQFHDSIVYLVCGKT